MQVTRTGQTPAEPDGARGVDDAGRASALVPGRLAAITPPPIRPRRRGRLVAAVVTVGLVVVGAWLGWLTLDAVRARTALQAAAGQVAQLQAQVLGGDRSAAESTLSALQDEAVTAQRLTHGPHWTLAGGLPGLGASVRAVQTVSQVVDDLARDALPALMDATALLEPSTLAPVDGRVDLAPLVTVGPQVLTADAVVQRSLEAVRTIPVDAVVPAIATQVTAFDARLSDVAMTTATATRVVRLLPPMLGADGPRHYLLLVQNNAELRATGGIPGSVVLLRTDGGAVDVVEQRSGGSLGDLAGPVLPLSPAEQALFGHDLAADMRDVTFTPDFPRSGEIAREIWRQEVGHEIDGVLSIDPGALAHVLGATGPVTLATGQRLTADNAIRLLLNTVYLEIEDPRQQDRFFAETADTVFDAMMSGRGDAVATVDALALSAREGRLMMWSAHPDEQALLGGTVLSGELRGVQGVSPVVGVYFNDAIPAKMGYYLRSDVTTSGTGCTADGEQTFTVTVDLTSTAPVDAATLPTYVTGTEVGFPPGDLQTNVLLYAPQGGRVESVRLDGAPTGVAAQIHDGLGVVGKTVQLAPGGTVRLAYDVVAGPGQTGAPVLRTTPVISGKTLTTEALDCSTASSGGR